MVEMLKESMCTLYGTLNSQDISRKWPEIGVNVANVARNK